MKVMQLLCCKFNQIGKNPLFTWTTSQFSVRSMILSLTVDLLFSCCLSHLSVVFNLEGKLPDSVLSSESLTVDDDDNETATDEVVL